MQKSIQADILYRYPALTEAEQEIEAYWQSLEEKAIEQLKCAGRKAPRAKMCGSAPIPDVCYEMAMPAACFEEALPAPEESEYDFEAERERMMKEIRERIERLRALGVDELMLRKLLEREDTLSRLVITRDFRILLPDYHDMEIEMSPLPKAVFLLYLRHEEGIPFKLLSDYEQELRAIYLQLTDRVQPEVIEKSIQALCDPTQNAINEKCTRIREAFVEKFDERLAQYYFVTGKRGEVKRIRLERALVSWER